MSVRKQEARLVHCDLLRIARSRQILVMESDNYLFSVGRTLHDDGRTCLYSERRTVQQMDISVDHTVLTEIRLEMILSSVAHIACYKSLHREHRRLCDDLSAYDKRAFSEQEYFAPRHCAVIEIHASVLDYILEITLVIGRILNIAERFYYHLEKVFALEIERLFQQELRR